jgi:excisionase family DNA binding protein
MVSDMDTIDPISELISDWRAEADKAEQRYGSASAAALLRSCADDLLKAREAFGAQVLTVPEAARELGCSETTIRNMVDDRRLTKVDRPGPVCIRRDQLGGIGWRRTAKPSVAREEAEDQRSSAEVFAELKASARRGHLRSVRTAEQGAA